MVNIYSAMWSKSVYVKDENGQHLRSNRIKIAIYPLCMHLSLYRHWYIVGSTNVLTSLSWIPVTCYLKRPIWIFLGKLGESWGWIGLVGLHPLSYGVTLKFFNIEWYNQRCDGKKKQNPGYWWRIEWYSGFFIPGAILLAYNTLQLYYGALCCKLLL